MKAAHPPLLLGPEAGRLGFRVCESQRRRGTRRVHPDTIQRLLGASGGPRLSFEQTEKGLWGRADACPGCLAALKMGELEWFGLHISTFEPFVGL